MVKELTKRRGNYETDIRRLEQRAKQIAYGENTPGYHNFLRALEVNPDLLKGCLPIKPAIGQKCSKRSWDGQIRKWRRALHMYDFVDFGDSAEQAEAVREALIDQNKNPLFTKMPKRVLPDGQEMFLAAQLEPKCEVRLPATYDASSATRVRYTIQDLMALANSPLVATCVELPESLMWLDKRYDLEDDVQDTVSDDDDVGVALWLSPCATGYPDSSLIHTPSSAAFTPGYTDRSSPAALTSAYRNTPSPAPGSAGVSASPSPTFGTPVRLFAEGQFSPTLSVGPDEDYLPKGWDARRAMLIGSSPQHAPAVTAASPLGDPAVCSNTYPMPVGEGYGRRLLPKPVSGEMGIMPSSSAMQLGVGPETKKQCRTAIGNPLHGASNLQQYHQEFQLDADQSSRSTYQSDAHAGCLCDSAVSSTAVGDTNVPPPWEEPDLTHMSAYSVENAGSSMPQHCTHDWYGADHADLSMHLPLSSGLPAAQELDVSWVEEVVKESQEMAEMTSVMLDYGRPESDLTLGHDEEAADFCDDGDLQSSDLCSMMETASILQTNDTSPAYSLFTPMLGESKRFFSVDFLCSESYESQ
jgi:hypothetical protein|uniref:Histone RNA hairpin-binding protein RNA-binding domain-containing protein n=1 Tax=Eutreptiella gymnastica TaxID=73025 RepID=A0A7S4GDZ4_9EUGL|mmetsp:Transcript_89654/g.149772  ORF Transcript_89654/g.149772 Transcript_89654/m.149772 type:complete len:583 (+) Transcript_89654:45-1793(+)|eukprot:CAMPEP_0174307584 /NCGR_PEP_ID=MMETSP0810-20121108/1209_1 /TAXON_ID=73025 ORGANISM="Eutreptiella gymnastica-like, Strain CCMP1594" /NCGR_SAMPLE_ID=MMETSP0810 /ASSEMBLY_ACC=CAM_ASM_000659 /LENGTH=582 /DNA_ID=CAMNT_0015414669 /DNA_START=41 /DNA_END=1789 /DNA_ORIENTATION=-